MSAKTANPPHRVEQLETVTDNVRPAVEAALEASGGLLRLGRRLPCRGGRWSSRRRSRRLLGPLIARTPHKDNGKSGHGR